MEAEIKNVFHAKGMQIIDIKGSSLCIDDVDLKKSDYQCTKFGQMEEYLGKQPNNVLRKKSGTWEIVPEQIDEKRRK